MENLLIELYQNIKEQRHTIKERQHIEKQCKLLNELPEHNFYWRCCHTAEFVLTEKIDEILTKIEEKKNESLYKF